MKISELLYFLFILHFRIIFLERDNKEQNEFICWFFFLKKMYNFLEVQKEKESGSFIRSLELVFFANLTLGSSNLNGMCRAQGRKD